jgi:hypothetical protein
VNGDATHAGARISVGSVRDCVRVTFERSDFEKVDKVVLSGTPAVPSATRKKYSDPDCVV